MLEFIRITDYRSPEMAEAMDIYREAFPPEERQPDQVILDRVASGQYIFWAGKRSENNELVLLAFLFILSQSEFFLLDYLAVKENYRGKGAGGALLDRLAPELRSAGKYLLLEVENPAFAPDYDQATRRLDFYKRQGTQLLQDVRYVLPALQGIKPSEMFLLVFPAYHAPTLPAARVKNLITQVYREVLGRDESDALLQSFIHSIPDPVRLD